jgi:hypothetical protein
MIDGANLTCQRWRVVQTANSTDKMTREADLKRGVHNLLIECAAAKPGDTLLILQEDHRHGFYGAGLAETIAMHAEALGLRPRLLDVPILPDAEDLPADVAAASADADHVLFLARLGDQLRFRSRPNGAQQIVSYVLDIEMLASPFATSPYRAFVALKGLFNDMFFSARNIRVTCGRGTDFQGRLLQPTGLKPADVGIKRFPMPVFAPLDATAFTGSVAVAHFLAGTGSKYYEPYGLPITGTVFAEIEHGRIVKWDGAPDEVANVMAHYRFVGDRYGIDRDVVHSWHAGIHPACAYRQSAHAQYERWTGGAFGNPRLLHFHTCGAYAPGEICWNIVDPTIEVDGRIVWRDGRIEVDAVPGMRDCLRRYPEVAALYEEPSQDIGIA